MNGHDELGLKAVGEGEKDAKSKALFAALTIGL